MLVQEIMTSGPMSISQSATLREALRKFDTFKLRCLPVVADGAYVGMLTEQSMRHALAGGAEGTAPGSAETLRCQIADFVQHDYPVVAPQLTLLPLIDLLLTSQVSMLPVVDPENGELCGLVDSLDVIKTARSLFHD